MPKIKEIDVVIGSKIKEARISCGLTQKDIANYLGITFQQIQKYEYGNNSIRASNLYVLSKLFKKPLNWFFDDKNKITINKNEKDCVSLLKSFRKVRKEDRTSILKFTRSLEKIKE